MAQELRNRPCGGRYGDIVQAIGNTPLVELKRLSPKPGVRLWAKLESLNPTGSVKDRVARALIEDAEEKGAIRPGQTILEPTSGNTGISLAMICSRKGYRLKVVMPDNVTPERTQLLKMYGAEIVYSPGNLGSNGAVELALKMASEDSSYYMPYQYGNAANPGAHYHGTAPEILEELDEVAAFVAGLGTGGTLMGVGRRLREELGDAVKIVAAEPMQGEPVQGLRSLDDGFIPPIIDLSLLDRKIFVTNHDAVVWTKKLLDEEGIFAGVSTGAIASIAVRIASELDEGNVVFIVCDDGWKYLSSGLYTKPVEELENLDTHGLVVTPPRAARRRRVAARRAAGRPRSPRSCRGRARRAAARVAGAAVAALNDDAAAARARARGARCAARVRARRRRPAPSRSRHRTGPRTRWRPSAPTLRRPRRRPSGCSRSAQYRELFAKLIAERRRGRVRAADRPAAADPTAFPGTPLNRADGPQARRRRAGHGGAAAVARARATDEGDAPARPVAARGGAALAYDRVLYADPLLAVLRSHEARSRARRSPPQLAAVGLGTPRAPEELGRPRHRRPAARAGGPGARRRARGGDRARGGPGRDLHGRAARRSPDAKIAMTAATILALARAASFHPARRPE